MNKKVLIITLLIVLLAGSIYFFLNIGKEDNKSDKVLKEAALDYFDKYVSVYSGARAYDITLQKLIAKDYKLEEFKNCNKEKTYVRLIIDQTNGKVIKAEIVKRC